MTNDGVMSLTGRLDVEGNLRNNRLATITGNSNNVAADSLSSGSLDASVQLQTLISSTQNKTY